MTLLSTSAASTTAVNSLSTSPGITTTTGMAGIAYVQTLSAQPLSTFTDTAGNTWNGTGAPALNVTLNGVHYYIYLLWTQNLTGGSNQIYTAAISNGPIMMSFHVQFFTGRVTSGTLFDGSIVTYTNASGLTNHVGPAVLTSFPNSVISSWAFDSGVATETFTAGTNFTLSTTANGSASTYFPSMAQYNLTVLPGTQHAAWTTANTVVGAGIAVALLSSAAPSSNQAQMMMGMG